MANSIPLKELEIEYLVRQARKSLIPFAGFFYTYLQIKKIQWGWFHLEIAEALEKLIRGDITRLMIFMPPQNGKSTLTTKTLPAWALGLHPDWNVISTSYSLQLALDHSRITRDIVNDPIYKRIFPEMILKEDVQSAHFWKTNQGGGLLAAGRGGSITGHGTDLLIIDDPLKDEKEARSKLIRDRCDEWYKTTAYSRLRPGGRVVLIQTRWNMDDQAGRLVDRMTDADNDQWTILSFPAIADGRDRRETGEALWPSMYPLPVLERKRAVLSPYHWNALYQQTPIADEGGIFRLEWFTNANRYNGDRPEQMRVVQSWDTAFKTGQENDYSVCTTWGDSGGKKYLLDVYKRRVTYPQLKADAKALFEKYKPSGILIEDKASGQSLIQDLRQTAALPVIARKPVSDKQARASAVSDMFAAGQVVLPQSAPWLSDFIYELTSFPNGIHDDQVDSVSQALEYLRGGSRSGSLLV